MSHDWTQPGRERDLIIDRAVELVDGVAQVRLPNRTVPLKLGGVPVTSFAPGWHPGALYLGFAPLLILEFHGDDGGQGLWLLDQTFNHVAGSIDRLPGELLELLRLRAVPILQEIASWLFAHASRTPGDAATAFLRLSPETRRHIGAILSEQVFPRPIGYVVDDFNGSAQAPVVLPIDPLSRAQPLSHRHLAAGFATDWQDRLLDAVANGILTWPSPIDGVPLGCRGSVIFDDFHFLYRFDDDRYGLVFYAVVGNHRSAVGGLWFPSLALLIGENAKQLDLGRLLARMLPTRLMSQTVDFTHQLATYFRSDVTGFANVLRGKPGVHIGHQLWNELTGIETLVATVPDADMVHLICSRLHAVELYGPIDELFPEIRGKVRRDFDNSDQMTEDAYRRGTIVVRITRDRVGAGLRDRLLGRARADARAMGRWHPAGPALLFGLRVENRTLVDLPGFLHRFMRMVDASFPELTIIFDGHNASGADGQAISSHGEWLARVPPHLVEQQLVAKLREDFPHRRSLIRDTLMQPVQTSLAMAGACCGFVSIWGASLAKYRWVANLPGYVITNRHNIHHRHDLDIYHSPKYMEDPAPLELIDPAFVTDLPHVEQLVPAGGKEPSFSNFEINDQEVFRAIKKFIQVCVDSRSSGLM